MPAAMAGKRVLVTRAREQSMRLAALLRREGAEPVVMPAICFAAPSDRRPLEEALGRLGDFSIAVFTSATGVRSFLAALETPRHDLGELHRLGLVAVGATTASAIADAGLQVEDIPRRRSAQGVAELLLARAHPTGRVLVVGPDPPDEALLATLREGGIDAHGVAAYRTIAGADDEEAARVAAGPPLDAALFYSPSAVHGTLASLPRALLSHGAIVAVGPTTARALQDAGLEAGAIAADPSDAAVIRALGELLARSRREEG